ncbi:cytochrome c oxidase-like protein-assembly factor COX23 [Plenodomus tracheiphilus IPT5]|uniref:Cytochrome c oxidase-like protein-assembly factor COX23 n=1 Tax=Plenodomus tracheiphilus IPT5 TaxID=1408161 RepID=A0A6A7BH89_9PLEO|nr:cytochrome c oxidase-like protein-assembly factor COX23 [Plenodomus tracheiphilus IPT5]
MSDKQPSSAPSATPSKGDEWTGPKANKFDNKAYSEYFDPCQEAADKSIRCLKRNGGERAMCSDFFQAYRECKEQWQNARKEARKNKSWFG